MVNLIQKTLKKHYLSKDDNFPWIVTYSGGKDSTTVLQITLNMMMEVGIKNCLKRVYIVSNDTMVESPLVAKHLHTSLAKIKKFIHEKKLPIIVKVTKPYVNDSFWFNLIGKGYPTPNNLFRWCTTRLKIDPTTRYIKEQVSSNGSVYMLLGTRYAESVNRAKSIRKYENKDSYFNNHNSLPNCKVASPIVDMSDDEVWEFLMENKPLWDKDNMELFNLYKDARGGECPTIFSKDETPSCGSTSPRFGCWTCTVVSKDRSLEGLIDSGYKEFEQLADFRNWLIDIRSIKKRRMRFNRQGNVRVRNGKLVHGPFTRSTRKEILKKLLDLQKKMDMELITKDEVFYIKKQWQEDSLMIDLINRD